MFAVLLSFEILNYICFILSTGKDLKIMSELSNITKWHLKMAVERK